MYRNPARSVGTEWSKSSLLLRNTESSLGLRSPHIPIRMQVSSERQLESLRSTLQDRIETLLPPRICTAALHDRSSLAVNEAASLTSVILGTHPNTRHEKSTSSTLASTLQTLVAILVTTTKADAHVSSRLSAFVSSAFAHVASHFGNSTELLPTLLGSLLIAASRPHPSTRWGLPLCMFSSSSWSKTSSNARHPLVIVLDALLMHWPTQPQSWNPVHYVNLADTVSIAISLSPQTVKLDEMVSRFTSSSPNNPVSLPCLAVCAGFCNAVVSRRIYQKQFDPLQNAFALLCEQAKPTIQPLCARNPFPFLIERHLPAISVLFCVASAGPLVFNNDDRRNVSSFSSSVLNDLRQSLDTLIIHSFSSMGGTLRGSQSAGGHSKPVHSDTQTKTPKNPNLTTQASPRMKDSTTSTTGNVTITNSMTEAHVQQRLSTNAKAKQLISPHIFDQPFQMTASRMAGVHAKLVQLTDATPTCLLMMQRVMTNDMTTSLKSIYMLTLVRYCSAYVGAQVNACFVDSLSFLQHYHEQRERRRHVNGSFDPPTHSRSLLFHASITPLVRSIATERSAVDTLASAACAVFDIDNVHRHSSVLDDVAQSLRSDSLHPSATLHLHLSRGLILTQYTAQALAIFSRSNMTGNEKTVKKNTQDDHDENDGQNNTNINDDNVSDHVWVRLVYRLLTMCSNIPVGFLRQTLNLPIILISSHHANGEILLAREYSITNTLRIITERYMSVNEAIRASSLSRTTSSVVKEIGTIRRCMFAVIAAMAEYVYDRPMLSSCLSNFVRLCFTSPSTSHSALTNSGKSSDGAITGDEVLSGHPDATDNFQVHLVSNFCKCLLYFMQMCDRQLVDIPMSCIEQLVGDSSQRRHSIRPLVVEAILRMELGRKDLCLRWFLDRFSALPEDDISFQVTNAVSPRAKL